MSTTTYLLPLRVDGISLGISRSLDLKMGQRGINIIELRVGQLDKGAILLNRGRLGRAGNRDDGWKTPATRAVGCPRDGKLCDSASLLGGESLGLLDQFEIEVEDVGLEAWVVLDEIREIVAGLDRAA